MSQRTITYPDKTNHSIEILDGFLLDSGELLINYIDFSQKTDTPDEMHFCYTTLIMTPDGWCKNPYHKEYDEYESSIICNYPVDYLPDEIGLEENNELITRIFDGRPKANPEALNTIEEIVQTFIALFPEKNMYEINTNMSIINLVRDLSAISNISLVALEEAKKELYEYFSGLDTENLQDKDVEDIIKQNGTIISRCAYEFGLKEELQALNEEIVEPVTEESTVIEPIYVPEVGSINDDYEVNTVFKPVVFSGKPELVIQEIPNGRRWISEDEYNRLRDMGIYVGREELSESDYRMLCDKFEVLIDLKKPMVESGIQFEMQPPIMSQPRALLEVTKHPDGSMSISQSAYETLIRQGFLLNSRFITQAELEMLEQIYEIVWMTAMEMEMQSLVPSGGNNYNNNNVNNIVTENSNDNSGTNLVSVNPSQRRYIVIDSRSCPENGNGTYNIASLLMGTCELIHYAETNDSVELVSGEKYNKDIVDYLIETHRRLRTNCSNSCKIPIDLVPSLTIGDIQYEFVGSYRFQEMNPEKNIVIEKQPEDKDTKETLVEGFMGRRNMIVDGFKNFEGIQHNEDGAMTLTKTNN